MKTLIFPILFIASGFAYADSARDQAVQWLTSLKPAATPLTNSDGTPSQMAKGSTFTGKTCSLYFTYTDGKITFITVGDNTYSGTDKERDGYVGIGFTDDLRVEVGNGSYTFSRNQSWGNDSKWNSVVIDVDGSGNPIRATGISDLQTISCDVK